MFSDWFALIEEIVNNLDIFVFGDPIGARSLNLQVIDIGPFNDIVKFIALEL